MYTVILYVRPSIEVPFFQPDSPTWQNPTIINYYNLLQVSGTLLSDVIEYSADNLVMKKLMTWKSFSDWNAYLDDFLTTFPNYYIEREQFHTANNSDFLINTYLSPTILISSTGKLNASIDLTIDENNVASATYTLN